MRLLFLQSGLALLWLVSLSGCLRGEDQSDVERPFPQLFDPENIGSTQFHFVTESVSDEFGYETTEEYVDLGTYKSALVKTNKNGHSVTYLDAKSDLIYHYKPYECMAMVPKEVELDGFKGIWNAVTKVQFGDERKNMRIYGVMAAWLNAGAMISKYSSYSQIYSSSKDVHKMAHEWTVEDPLNNESVHLFFAEIDTYPYYSLEMIQVDGLGDKRTKRTINVLEFNRYIPKDVANNLLEVPTSYGCHNKEVSDKAMYEIPELEDMYLGPLLSESHKIELEATGTRFQNGGDLDQKVVSSTISVTLAKHKVEDTTGGGQLQLIRRRTSNSDTKRILHFHFNVAYNMDTRAGSCNMENLGQFNDTGERLDLDFENGLKLPMNLGMMKFIFVEMDEFYFIKEVNDGGPGKLSYLYFERSFSTLFDHPARVVRVFTRSKDEKRIQLDRVIVWIYNDQSNRILESYHFNIIEAVELTNNGVALAKLFDISEECYLNNPEMHPNKEYAWFQLTYAMPTRQRELLAANSVAVKQMIHDRFLIMGHLSFFRVPRIELLFEETGLVVRALLLDIPKLTVIFNQDKGKTMVMEATSGDHSELSVDADHCANLCRLNRCQTFSYCQDSHQCSMSLRSKNTNYPKLVLENAPKCTTFSVPDFFYRGAIEELSLHRTISLLQHQDYSAISLPKTPEELTYSRTETGLDESEYTALKLKFLDEVADYLDHESHRLPMLTFSIMLQEVMVFMVPTHFELENDPLADFNLAASDESADGDDPDRVPTFHQGLQMSRYKMTLLAPVESGDRPKPKARLFSGLNYDQCALACIDGKCSSFSYCGNRQECIIADIYEISAFAKDYVQQDPECFIAQRDFITKFNKFPNVARSYLYKQVTYAANPSECAHTCIASINTFQCLAFDFCPPLKAGEQTSCLYFDERQIFTEAAGSLGDKGKKPAGDQPQATGCDHYSRSYLADFQRIEYRQVNDDELSKLKTSTLEGKSVDQCAEVCVTDEMDCTAFQFCIDPDVTPQQGSMQSCTLIESVPQGDKREFEAVVDKGDDGKVVKAGKFFLPNINCHVFSLRRDSSEAQVRELALSSLTEEELAKRKKGGNSSGGVTLGGGILIFLGLAALFAALGAGFVYAKHNNEYLRQKVDRVQALLRYS